MKYFAILLVLAVLPFALLSQETKAPRLEKTAIGSSGSSAYLPANMPEFELSYSEDKAEVYTSEIEIDSFAFGCIAVKFAEPFTDSDPEEMETLLISYLDFLKGAFEITGAAGYGRGHTMDTHPDARGVLDYWEDAQKVQYVVKGWVNQRNLGILYIAGPREYPYFNLQQLYLNGWRFE